MSGGGALGAALEVARHAGALGPGPVEPHIEHARGFADVAEVVLGRPPALFTDLGSGGGLPVLVLLDAWPDARGVLIESSVRRAALLERLTGELGWQSRVDIRVERAEVAARDASLRERAPLVTARSFGPPAVTAEMATGFAAVGGIVVVSEPPEQVAERWPAARLERLGFGPAERYEARGARFVVLAKAVPVAGDVPRAVGKPTKRPLW